jgi:hypothetical protein
VKHASRPPHDIRPLRMQPMQTMQRRRMLVLAALAWMAPVAVAAPKLANFRFGILRAVSGDIFEFTSETRRIPRRVKSTGFRFGVGFDNPTREMIEWYSVIHLPGSPRKASGGFERAGPDVLRGESTRSDRASPIDYFWFDEGDPLGKHRLELFVNNALRYTVDFEVVAEK